MAGRKPIPTNLKIVKGTAQKCRINGDEIRPDATIPQPPDHLGKYALMEWGRITPELASLGILTQIDMAALAGYCQAFDRWVRAESGVHKNGLTIETTNGNIIQNPMVGIANKAMELMHKFLTEFGMTPSSRTRISAPSKKEENPWSQFDKSGAK